jgi:hypothetical protein
MKRLLPLLTVALCAAPALAQTVYEPVQYQFGPYGEVFYGGRVPVTNSTYSYAPPALMGGALGQSYNGQPYLSPFSGIGPNGPVVSPYQILGQRIVGHTTYAPYIFTDFAPYDEAGHLGYTINDVHNEAYANVPLLQMAAHHEEAPVAEEHAVASDPRIKAIPLLNWAKAERTRNPLLYRSLLQEARKYDASATDAVARSAK